MTTQLVLNQRGSSLSMSGGRYRVRTREREFFLPVYEVSSIVLHTATRLSHEVVMTAIAHNTDVLFVDRKGFPTGRIWSGQFGSVATIRKHQLAFAQQREGREWVRGLLLRKLTNQLTVLDLLVPATDQDGAQYVAACQSLMRLRSQLETVPIEDTSECFARFRGLEGSAGRVYFGQINACLPQQYQFVRRSGRGATDAFNCLLNYAYGMLYGQCESALIQAGIDPYIGVMHRDNYNRPVLVYDFIEPFRAWADYVVCHLLMQEVVFDEFFEDNDQSQNDASDQALLRSRYLNTAGKRILIQAMNDYLAELVSMGGLTRSRGQHIVLEAQQLASQLKKMPLPA